MIEISISLDNITDTLDALGKAMRNIANLRELIATEGVFYIKNVVDFNYEGAQCKRFPISQVDCEEYKYFDLYALPISRLSKSECEKRVRILESIGINAYFLKNTALGGYDIDIGQNVSKFQAQQATEKGIEFLKIMRRTPRFATSVIFAGKKGLAVLNTALKDAQ